MKTPVLDNRTKAEIMAQVDQVAAEYVPEWHYNGDTTDPGGALAELFGEMFYQTVDRFNAVPQKLYTEFLNLLGVQVPPVTPASGLIEFQVHEGVQEPVEIPGGSLLYTQDAEGEHVVYETGRSIAATPAQLEAVYFSDPRAGLIQELDLSREQPFFVPVEGENLQCHRFAVSQNDVLSVKGPCEIEVRLLSHARFLEESMAKDLADPAFASWSWRRGKELTPFDQVRSDGEKIILTKTASDEMTAEEDGRICVFCDMAAGAGAISVDGVRLRSNPLEELPADSISYNDIPISQEDGGYCFGRMPAPYELFYIRSDVAFSKRGAQVRLQLDIQPIVYSEVDSSPQYLFNRRVIDKNDAVVIRPDDVFVREVVWEYYTGSGWANLPVEGNKNPFSGKEEGKLELRFTVPDDIDTVLVNAQMGGYIRARVVEVENRLSPIPRWILPFVKTVTCSWQYDETCPVDWIWASNNAREQSLENIASVTELRFEVYADQADRQRSMYLCFDHPLEGLPVSILFEVLGKSAPREKILYEGWNGKGFQEIRVLDGTNTLSHAGPVYLYLPNPLVQGDFFGRQGYWLRMSLTRLTGPEERPPVIGGIRFNVVEAVQRQRAPEERFTVQGYEAGKVIRLMETPVLSCEIWVDEASSLSAAELESLSPEDTRLVREDGDVSSCLVKWNQVSSLAHAGPEDRVYELDSHTGTVRFGDGIRGRVPPAGFQNIRVFSSYGGGSRGNCPADTVRDFLVSVPRIASLRNVTPMGGGTDKMDLDRLESLGNRRIRHRGRAVGILDFEELVAEHFGQVAHVKCFSGLDEAGEKQSGHLCVVIMGNGLDSQRAEQDLCQRVYQFLEERCDCTMTASGRLHVRPAVEMTIHIDLQVTLRDLDQGADTQQAIVGELTRLIEERWRAREIGEQIKADEVYNVVKAIPNVAAITRAAIEGTWYEDGRLRMTPIEADGNFPFAVVRSGNHLVRIS